MLHVLDIGLVCHSRLVLVLLFEYDVLTLRGLLRAAVIVLILADSWWLLQMCQPDIWVIIVALNHRLTILRLL